MDNEIIINTNDYDDNNNKGMQPNGDDDATYISEQIEIDVMDMHLMKYVNIFEHKPKMKKIEWKQ